MDSTPALRLIRTSIPMPEAPEKRDGLLGKVFSRLTVVERLTTSSDKYKYVCACSCGKFTEVRKYNLLNGAIKSCGCLRLEGITANGLVVSSGLKDTPEYVVYRTWLSMWNRCTSPANENYRLYKDRKPPEEWKDFTVFLAHIGLKPGPEYSIDRIDNEKPYGPGNVRWATQKEQRANTRNTCLLMYNGKNQTLTQWAKDLGVPRKVLYERLYVAKLPLAEVLTSLVTH